MGRKVGAKDIKKRITTNYFKKVNPRRAYGRKKDSKDSEQRETFNYWRRYNSWEARMHQSEKDKRFEPFRERHRYLLWLYGCIVGWKGKRYRSRDSKKFKIPGIYLNLITMKGSIAGGKGSQSYSWEATESDYERVLQKKEKLKDIFREMEELDLELDLEVERFKKETGYECINNKQNNQS